MNKLKIILQGFKFFCNKNAPQIITGLGIIAVGAGAASTVKGTLNCVEILNKYAETKENIAKAIELSSKEEEPQYSEKEISDDILVNKVSTITKIVVGYVPALIFFTIGISSFVTANKILLKRNAAIMAAYASLDRIFAKYRERVAAKLGKDANAEFRYGEGELESIDTSDEKAVDDFNLSNGYARIFKPITYNFEGSWEGSSVWGPTYDYNVEFILTKLRTVKELYDKDGIVTLNQAYSLLGFPVTEYGNVVGWRKDRGDVVSFFPNNDERPMLAGKNGDAILLDFNVSNIYNENKAIKQLVRDSKNA